jgi:hypothetical protein
MFVHRCERTKGSKGEGQIAWTDLKGLRGSGPVFRRVCVQVTDANHRSRTDNPEQYAADQKELSFFCYV